MGRGGAYVPARVALQGRIHRSIPRAQCVMHKTHFPYGNAAVRTFGRAHRHRPYVFRLGGLHVNGYFVCIERFCKVSDIVPENVRYWVAICA